MKTNIETHNIDEIVRRIEAIPTDSLVVIIDKNVWEIYEKKFKHLKNATYWIAKAGEDTKNFNEVEKCIEFILEKGIIHRKSHLIAIGGGALSDFAGFVASTMLRGIPWSVVPTTLLSMVDASIGGKVAINSKYGKNLIGMFHLPMNIWSDHSFLKTVSEEHILSGKGEIIKYCFLDCDIFDAVISGLEMREIISKCAKFKQNLTEEDFRELGRRKILNLGHTFGHAIEKIYSLPHGVAIVWGMALVFKLFDDKKNLCHLSKLKTALHMPKEKSPWHGTDFPTTRMMDYFIRDKKATQNKLVELILIDEIGNTKILPVSPKDIKEKIKRIINELNKLTI